MAKVLNFEIKWEIDEEAKAKEDAEKAKDAAEDAKSDA